MGLLPRMEIRQTSDKAQGQIYVPLTNWTLYIAVIYLVLTFQNSSNLAAAYGIAVTGTMLIDTILIAFVLVAWRWSPLLVIPLIGTFLTVDLAFFSANALKIPQGGWFPLGIACISFTVLTTWKLGRRLLSEEVARQAVPIQIVLDSADGVNRAEGTAIFLTSLKDGTPSSLLHNLKHNQVLHERNVLLTVILEDKPYVTKGNRLLINDMGKGFYRLRIFYGFMETPDVPTALELCAKQGLVFDMMNTSFFISHEVIIGVSNSGMMHWRKRLFTTLAKNAMNAAEFFNIPANRVIEMGTRIEI
jgi:KUP system potassium uptake protein